MSHKLISNPIWTLFNCLKIDLYQIVCLNRINMSGEQLTNNAVETQTLEGELHSLKYSSKKKRVDINDLLNKVRSAEKKEKIESTIFFGLVAAVIVVTGIIVSI